MLCFDISLVRDAFSLTAQGEFPLSGVTAVFGPSGSGKTTFLRSLAGLEPNRGVVRLERGGKSSPVIWQDDAAKIRVPAEKRGVGYVFQEAVLIPHLSVMRNLLYAWQRVPRVRRHGSVQDVIELIGISHLLERMPHALSGGEKQRVAIARGLLACPQVLLMDEPLASLDERAKKELLSGLDRVRREMQVPIVYVTHSIAEVARLADRVLRFEDGCAQGLCAVVDLLSRVENYGHDVQSFVSRLEVRLKGYDEKHQIAHYAFGEDTIYVPSPPGVREGATRLLIRARELSLSLHGADDSSILNSIPVTIIGHELLDGARILVRCAHPAGNLYAAITTLAFEKLQIKEGLSCLARFKAVALDA